MRHAPRLLPFAAAAVMAAFLGATSSARVAVIRTIYFSATDSKGAPVTDLTPAELTVKEGGKERPVTAVQPARGPMQIAMIIDDGGTGAFQAATLQFLNKLLDRAVFSIRLVNTQALRLVDYTNDADALKTALMKMGQRGRVQPDGDQVIEAIGEAARELQQHKADRPVIVVFTVYGESHQAVDPEVILSQLKSSSASLNVMHITGAASGQVTGDGSKQSGGRFDEVLAGPGIAPGALKIADTLLSQLMLTYTLPDGVKPADRLSVSVSRKGVSLLAPTRVPDK